jgi:hypothetical protein
MRLTVAERKKDRSILISLTRKIASCTQLSPRDWSCKSGSYRSKTKIAANFLLATRENAFISTLKITVRLAQKTFGYF